MHILRAVMLLMMILTFGLPVLYAQDDYEPGPDNKFNSNLAFVVTTTLNPTAKYAHAGWGLVYGAGYNINRHHSLISEVMWTRLYPTTGALAPIREALNTNDIHGHADLLALTANYRLQFQREVLGTYLITGAGMYYRDVSLTQHVTTGSSITCTPEWLWWGFTCTSGSVTSGQSIGGASSFTSGGNVGFGVTFKLPDSWWKVYVEARYHYARSKSISTQVIPITLGIRF